MPERIMNPHVPVAHIRTVGLSEYAAEYGLKSPGSLREIPHRPMKYNYRDMNVTKTNGPNSSSNSTPPFATVDSGRHTIAGETEGLLALLLLACNDGPVSWQSATLLHYFRISGVGCGTRLTAWVTKYGVDRGGDRTVAVGHRIRRSHSKTFR